MSIARFFAAVFIFTAAIFGETIGSIPLYVCMLGIFIAGLAYPQSFYRTLNAIGIIPWLVPALLLLSATWSLVPAITIRFALQNALTILFAIQITRLVNRQQFALIMLLVCGFVCVASLASGRMGMDGLTGRMNLVGVLSHKNSLGYCASLLSIIAAAVLADATSTRFWRALAIGALLIGVVTALKSGSIGALAALTLGILIFVSLSLPSLYPSRQRATIVEISVVIGVALAATLGLCVYFFQDVFLAFVGKDATLTGRTTLWFYAGRVWSERPWLGMGAASFWVQGYGPAEFLWRTMHVTSRTGFHFHSLIYQTLVETGLVGLAALGLFIANSLRASLSDLRRGYSAMGALYLSVALYTLVIQMQGVDLMQPFAPAFLVFATSAFYAKQALAGAKSRPHGPVGATRAARVSMPIRTDPAGGRA